ncbi:unnamed protein product [Eruca vesicaria subsp. sativa]|uniref:Uncharacterized protein n=1 Tax=Eruca vesicaria subsp. sativa TaxID=29727 RepID=A0ABC8LA43_ERUVS|nr:unnamed protein product [Eruca vesicaria subsp. sativa]
MVDSDVFTNRILRRSREGFWGFVSLWLTRSFSMKVSLLDLGQSNWDGILMRIWVIEKSQRIQCDIRFPLVQSPIWKGWRCIMIGRSSFDLVIKDVQVENMLMSATAIKIGFGTKGRFWELDN